MSASVVKFYFLSDRRIFFGDSDLDRYLAGRPRDSRVRYATAVNNGKKYPYSSKRQNSRNARHDGQNA